MAMHQRVLDSLLTSETAAGSQKGKGTAVHQLILNSLLTVEVAAGSQEGKDTAVQQRILGSLLKSGAAAVVVAARWRPEKFRGIA